MKKTLVIAALLPLAIAGCSSGTDSPSATSITSPASFTTSSTAASPSATSSEDIDSVTPGNATTSSYDNATGGIDSNDDAALATLASEGMSCPSDQQCLAAVQSACAILEMGYTSDDIYTEMYLFPDERLLPDFPNSAVPHFLGVAKGGYCANY